MKPEIFSILPSGHGHWTVKVRQSYKYSQNIWTYTTDDSLLIDYYKEGHPKKAVAELIRRAKTNGSKKTIKI